jgi:hypothetical protein
MQFGYIFGYTSVSYFCLTEANDSCCMVKTRALAVRVTAEQALLLSQKARGIGCSRTAYIRLALFQDTLFVPEEDLEIIKLRNERKSFYCSRELWDLLLGHVKDKASVSSYIRKALEEKLYRESKFFRKTWGTL